MSNGIEIRDLLIACWNARQAELEERDANYGGLSHREVLRQGVMKVAGQWHQGATSKRILEELGLIGKRYMLTKKGQRYLYFAWHDGNNF
jgi:hypothetical protein